MTLLTRIQWQQYSKNPFLSDPSPIIGMWSLTNWLRKHIVDFIYVILACEDANSKLVEVVTVADVDDEDHVGNSLLQI